MSIDVKGFTLIELMVTVAVLAIVAMIAVPSFQSTIASNQLDEGRDRLRSAIQFAKSEAIARNDTVSLCPSADGIGCGDNSNWNGFWLVVEDSNASGSVSIANTLRVFDAPAAGQVQVRHSDGQTVLRFTPEGIAPDLNSDTFSFCDPEADSDPRSMLVASVTGVVRYGTKAEANCP